MNYVNLKYVYVFHNAIMIKLFRHDIKELSQIIYTNI